MNTKQTAAFFLYLFVFQYVLGVALAVGPDCDDDGHSHRRGYLGGYEGGFDGGHGEGGCRFSGALKRKLNMCYAKAKDGTSGPYECEDQKTDKVKFTKVSFRHTQMGDGEFTCVCDGKEVLILVKVYYLSALLEGVFNLIGGLLGSILGGLGKSIAHLLKGIVDLLLKILCLDIVADVKLRFVPGEKCVLEDVTITNLTVKILGLGISLGKLISKLLSGILLFLIRDVLVKNFANYFIECLGIVNRKDIIGKC